MFFFPVLLYHQHCKVNQKEESSRYGFVSLEGIFCLYHLFITFYTHIDKKLIIREKQHNQSLYITLLAIHIYPLFFHREVRLPILLLSFSLF